MQYVLLGENNRLLLTAYIQLIQRLYVGSIEQQQELQRQLHDLQQRVEAWGLIAPFLQHEDPNVQFFGAHTAQVKISRDWQVNVYQLCVPRS